MNNNFDRFFFERMLKKDGRGISSYRSLCRIIYNEARFSLRNKDKFIENIITNRTREYKKQIKDLKCKITTLERRLNESRSEK